jgi:hypothetical protein
LFMSAHSSSQGNQTLSELSFAGRLPQIPTLARSPVRNSN